MYFKKLLLILSVYLPFTLFCQKKPTNFVLGTYPAISPGNSYTTNGFGVNYNIANTYNLQYGKQNNTTQGFNRVVKLFTVESESYSLTKAVPGAQPFRQVILNRNSATVKNTALFEVAAPQDVSNNSTLYLTPDYVSTTENLINSYVINRGTDNLFINVGFTNNNIERVDMLLEQPVNISDINPATSGFLLLERGGNDVFKVSAVTGTSGNTITQLGNPVTVNIANWGLSGQLFQSVVMQQVVGIDNNLKPSQNINEQNISGVFISLADLGLTAGTTIYGISFFAGDVNLTPAQLLTISNYPATTSEVNNYGIDFMAGGGFFTKAILITGTIWKDVNSDAVKANSEVSFDNGLWANLVDPSGKVVSSVKVNADGTYTAFVASNGIVDGNYSIILTNSEKYEGNMLTAADTPNNGYTYTGVNVNGVANTANRTGQVVIGSIAETNIPGINFGLRNLALPITLGDFKASITNNQLVVQWSTLSETNNAYFDIEVSSDGKNFKKIGMVTSKAMNGNADTIIDYNFNTDATNRFGLLSIPVFLLAFMVLLFLNRKNKWTYTLAIICSIGFLSTTSCIKKDRQSVERTGKLFARIKQVDKDGKYEYSKVIQVINE